MSRILDILARAERDGTTRRLPADSPRQAANARTPEAPTPGTAAMLDAGPFAASAAEPRLPASATTAAAAALRSATPMLHPALVAVIAPHSDAAEQYRAIRTRLMLYEEHAPLRVLLVSSPGADDGKSLTAANLALTMAQQYQHTVVLVDADLRTPTVHTLFGVGSSPGLSEVLGGQASVDEALIHLPDLRLTLLPGGAAPPFPTELLGSTAMRRAMDQLRGRFDRILLDLPAVVPLADVGTVAPAADGVLLVVRAGVTQRPALERARAALAEEKVVGVVVNDVC